MSDLAEKNPGAAAARDPHDGEPPRGTAPAFLPPRPSLSVALKLTLLVGLTLALLLAGLLTGGWFYWRKVLRTQVDGQLSAIAASRRDMVQAQVALLLQRMTLNTDRGEVRGFFYELAEGRPDAGNRASSQTSLERIADGRPILSAALADTTGRIVLSSNAAEVGQDVSATSEFQAGLHEGDVGWPRAVEGRFEATLAAPIRARGDPKRVYGALIATVDVSDLAAALRDTTGLGQTGEAILAVRTGDHLRFLFPPRNSPTTTVVPLEAAPALAAAAGGGASFRRTRAYRGVPVLAASQPINYRNWALVVKMDVAEAYAPVKRALRLGGLAGLAVIALGLVATYALARHFTRPVRRLAEAAARVAGGDYTSQVPVQSADELGTLSASFNEMTAAIRARRTERDEAEEALRESEARSRQIAESLPQLVWTCQADGPCDYLSPQWVKYTGIAAAPQLGYGWLDQVHPEDRPRVLAQWQAVAGSGHTLDMQFRIRRHDGVYRWFRTRAMPLKDDRGRVVKWFGTNTDIDDAQRAEETLREADRRKDEFLAMLGHELRNPLAAIAHAVRLEQEAAHDPGAIGLARSVIARQTGNLNRLVGDLLDVARITKGKIELRKQPVEVGKIVAQAVEAVRPLLEERRHALELSLTGGGPWRVQADPTRLEQIISNLLTNAAKYTPDGGRITVVERHEGRDAVITVSDNGIGIAPEMLPQIFELFTQADRSLDRTTGGLGLGLSLCRQLVELHGGTISAHSNGIGRGAAFTVRLPAVAMPEAAPPAPFPMPVASDHPRRRILLVDDNQDTVHSLTRLLVRRGHEVATAYDGLTALKTAHEFQPEVLLLDLGLPGLDGYELARRLRADGFPHAPIIAISGYAQESDRDRSRAAGFNYHFAKPVDFEALAELIVEEPFSLD